MTGGERLDAASSDWLVKEVTQGRAVVADGWGQLEQGGLVTVTPTPPGAAGPPDPGLDVVGSHHGYFEPGTPHNERVLEDVNARRPNILLVGMGSPKQELWVDRYADRLDVDILWTVGALFDYVSGRVPRAPRWLADNGLEWIFRLGIEPQRMWRRYLLGNPVFLSRVVAETRRRRTTATQG